MWDGAMLSGFLPDELAQNNHWLPIVQAFEDIVPILQADISDFSRSEFPKTWENLSQIDQKATNDGILSVPFLECGEALEVKKTVAHNHVSQALSENEDGEADLPAVWGIVLDEAPAE